MKGRRFVVSGPAVTVVKGDVDERVHDALRAAGRVACDIETSGLEWSTARIGTFQLHTPAVGAIVVQLNGATPNRLRRLIGDPQVRKVFHHAPFDLRFIAAHWEVTARNVACTKIASKLLDPDLANDEHSLKALLWRYLAVDISKDEQVSDWLARDLSDAQLAYAAGDVAYLLPLLDCLTTRLRSERLDGLFEQCLAHLPTRVELDLRHYPDIYLY
jgi:ribonuclease D